MQTAAISKIPLAMADLDARLAKVLAETLPRETHVVPAGVRASKPKAVTPPKQEVRDVPGRILRDVDEPAPKPAAKPASGRAATPPKKTPTPKPPEEKPPLKDKPDQLKRVESTANTRTQEVDEPNGGAPKEDRPAGAQTPSSEETLLAKTQGTSAEHISAREKVARNYLENNGFSQSQISDALGSTDGKIVGGMDLTKPVEVISFPPPDTMSQYVKSHGYPGNWFDPKGNQTPDALGISGDSRTLKDFKMPTGSGLSSYSKPILDKWTNPSAPIQTAGGGQQLFVNDAIKNEVVSLNNIGN